MGAEGVDEIRMEKGFVSCPAIHKGAVLFQLEDRLGLPGEQRLDRVFFS